MTNKRPNILIFNPDQWRGDMVGYLGYPGAQTPNLDNIINNHIVFFLDKKHIKNNNKNA